MRLLHNSAILMERKLKMLHDMQDKLLPIEKQK